MIDVVVDRKYDSSSIDIIESEPIYKLGLQVQLLPVLRYVQKSSDPFYILNYYIKWVTTSWTDGIKSNITRKLFVQYIVITELYT